jgi:hypothetical protein
MGGKNFPFISSERIIWILKNPTRYLQGTEHEAEVKHVTDVGL